MSLGKSHFAFIAIAFACNAFGAIVVDGTSSVLQSRTRVDTVSSSPRIVQTNGLTIDESVSDVGGIGSATTIGSIGTRAMGVASSRVSTPPTSAAPFVQAQIRYFEFATFSTAPAGGTFSYSVDFDGLGIAGRLGTTGASWAILGSGVRIYDVTGVPDPLITIPGQGEELFANGRRIDCAGHVVELRTTTPIVGVGPCDAITRIVSDADADPVELAAAYSGTARVLNGRKYLLEWFFSADAILDAGGDDMLFAGVDALHSAHFSLTGFSDAAVISSTGPLLGLTTPPVLPTPGTVALTLLSLMGVCRKRGSTRGRR